MTPTQCKMARAALDMGIAQLSEASKVSARTIARFEKGETLYPRTARDIQEALEAHGIEFIDGGARLRHAGVER
jgi:transcriptional regulator with XRE-family HTH domain